MPKFKTIYDTLHEKPGITITTPSMTVQAEKANCDINNIMQRYATTGVLPVQQNIEPVYADVSQIGDYQEAFDTVMKAESAFNALPSQLRKELDNNPANLISYIQNPDNRERCYTYGLLNRPIVETPKVVVSDSSNSLSVASDVRSADSAVQ